MFNTAQFNQIEYNQVIDFLFNLLGANTIPIILDQFEELAVVDLSSPETRLYSDAGNSAVVL